MKFDCCAGVSMDFFLCRSGLRDDFSNAGFYGLHAVGQMIAKCNSSMVMIIAIDCGCAYEIIYEYLMLLSYTMY